VPDGDHKRQDEGTPLSSARARVRISDPGGTNGACEPRSSPLNRGRRLAVSQVVKRGRSGWSSGHSSHRHAWCSCCSKPSSSEKASDNW